MKTGCFEVPILITNEVYMEIHVLKKQGYSLRRIAQEVGCAQSTQYVVTWYRRGS